MKGNQVVLTECPTVTATVAKLIMSWGVGWTVSRGTPAPVPVPGGFRVDVGLPGHRVRHVLHTWDADSVGRLAGQLTTPGSWIKVAGDRAGLRAALPPGWRLDIPGYLMTAPFTADPVDPVPPPYRVEVGADGGAVVATVRDAHGGPAASGRLGAAGEYGVIDQVLTDPTHRRRGLGSVVMAALRRHAVRRGGRTGVLVATDDGRALYERLGWVVCTGVSGAFLPEDR